MTRLRSAKHLAAGESGYSLVELLTVLVILGTVLGGLTGVFVSALRAEVDMNERFQAQQEARLALTKLRREVHCARSAQISDGGATVTLTSAVAAPTRYCTKTGDSTWCARTLGPGRYALYVQQGLTCDPATARRVADYLTTSAVFAVEHPPRRQATLNINLQIDSNTADTRRDYRLRDAIALRASVRGTSANGVCDPPAGVDDWNPNCPTTYTPAGAPRAPHFYNATNPWDTGFHRQFNADVARANGYDPVKVEWWDYDFAQPEGIE